MIVCENVSFGYDNQNILSNISVNISENEFIGVIGANGAGKSTFTKLLLGLYKPTEGDIYVFDQNTKTTKTSQLARHIGYLFQNPDRQLFAPTIEKELSFGLELITKDKDFIKQKVNQIIDLFHFDKSKSPQSASRGERQRIALASLLILEPKALILDEPTTGLDYKECIHIMELINNLYNKKGITVIMVSHDMEIINDYAKRVLIINQEKLIYDGPVHGAMANEALLAEASLLPPQIIGLCNALGPEYQNINSYSELAGEIIKRAPRATQQ